MDDIINYYNKQKKNINIPDEVEIKFSKDKDKDKVEIYDNKKKLLIKTNYSIIGLFNNTNSIWYWGWILDFADRNLVDQTKQIKEWGEKMFIKYKPKTKHEQTIYFYTKNGSFMTSSVNIPFFAKLAMYVLKGKFYFPITHDDKNTDSIQEYIIIY